MAAERKAEKTMKRYLKVYKVYTTLIEENVNKIPKYYENTTDIMEKELEVKDYKSLIFEKYYNLLDEVGKYINKYEINIANVKNSIIDNIDKYHRLHSLHKPCFSKPEDELIENNDNSNENNDNSDKKNVKMSQTNFDESMKNLNNALKHATETKDNKLINNLTKTISDLSKNCKNNTIKTNNKTTDIFIKAPKWLENLKCSINPKFTKNSDFNSFEYALAISETSNPNRNRLKNIEPNLETFNFDNINYPPNKEDYKKFEENNELIQLSVYKLTDTEDGLYMYYHNTDNNNRNKKVTIILLKNDYYIYLTRLYLLTKYIRCD